MNTETTILADTFRDIIHRAEGRAPSEPKPDSADPASFGAAISATVLPRTLTLRCADGPRLSIIARNRRIVRVVEVHPAELWRGEAAPHETACEAGSEDFARSFTDCLLAVSAGETPSIDRRLVDGDIAADTLAGYPAARLAEDLAHGLEARKADPLHDLRTGWADHARAWIGAEDGVDVPDGYPVDAAWMQARLTEWATAADADEDDLTLRFLIIAGDAPLAIAFAAAGSDRCIVACSASQEFPRLEGDLATLRDRQGRM